MENMSHRIEHMAVISSFDLLKIQFKVIERVKYFIVQLVTSRS